MQKKVSLVNVVRFAGAYIAYIIGSGFASGQEIMQFYTGYGLRSIFAVLISAVLFIWVGVTVMRIGFDHRGDGSFRPYREICGRYPGIFYEIFTYVYLFCIVVVMISGAGATLSEYFGLNHYVGSLIMAVLVFVSIAFGLNKLINAIGMIGPVVVCFTVAVCAVTLSGYGANLRNADSVMQTLSMQTPTKNFIGGGVLYAAYNLICAILFFSTLGGETQSRREATLGAAVGGTCLILTILMMDLAFLSRIGDVASLEIPTLLLAGGISPLAGIIFLVILFCGIFSTAAPMSWTVCDKLCPATKGRKRSVPVSAGVVSAAFACGLLPFSKLVGIIYPASGYLGLVFFGFLLVYRLRARIRDAGHAAKKSAREGE